MPEWIIPDAAPRQVALLLFPRFSMHCFANALEPLRAANGFLGRQAYRWRICTPDGEAVHSSSGVRVMPDGPLARMRGDSLVLLPSYGYRGFATPRMGQALRAAAGRFDRLIGLDAGAWLMAAAGLLDGRPAVIHDAEADAFAEAFPDVSVRRARFVDDGDRVTGGGAATTFDLMQHLIGRDHGAALTLQIAALFLDGRATGGRATGGRVPADARVARALAAMEANLESPLPLAELARRAGCTRRSLEARFRGTLGATPRTVYRQVRLNAAHRMVTDSELGLAEIAGRCGYGDQSAFGRAFRRAFGLAPRALRAGSRQG